MQERERIRESSVDLACTLWEKGCYGADHLEVPVPLDVIFTFQRLEATEIVAGGSGAVVKGRYEVAEPTERLVGLVGVANHGMAKSIGGHRELDRHERLVLPLVDVIKTTLPHLSIAAHQLQYERALPGVFVSNSSEEVIPYDVLIQPAKGVACTSERVAMPCFAGSVDQFIVRHQECDLELANDGVLIVPHISDECSVSEPRQVW